MHKIILMFMLCVGFNLFLAAFDISDHLKKAYNHINCSQDQLNASQDNQFSKQLFTSQRNLAVSDGILTDVIENPQLLKLENPLEDANKLGHKSLEIKKILYSNNDDKLKKSHTCQQQAKLSDLMNSSRCLQDPKNVSRIEGVAAFLHPDCSQQVIVEYSDYARYQSLKKSTKLSDNDIDQKIFGERAFLLSIMGYLSYTYPGTVFFMRMSQALLHSLYKLHSRISFRDFYEKDPEQARDKLKSSFVPLKDQIVKNTIYFGPWVYQYHRFLMDQRLLNDYYNNFMRAPDAELEPINLAQRQIVQDTINSGPQAVPVIVGTQVSHIPTHESTSNYSVGIDECLLMTPIKNSDSLCQNLPLVYTEVLNPGEVIENIPVCWYSRKS